MGNIIKNKEKPLDKIHNIIYKKSHGRVTMSYDALLAIWNFKAYIKTYKFLKESQWWSSEKLKNYQLQQLKNLLEHSYENVPYYKKIFDKNRLKPADVKSIEDLNKLPFLTKEIIRENTDQLKAKNYPEYKFGFETTSGSTGFPLLFYDEKGVSYAKELAYLRVILDRFGISYKDKFVFLRDAVIPLESPEKFFRYSMFRKCLILSSFQMTDENIPKYIKKIRKHKPKFITAYPSAITILAKYMKNKNIDFFPSIKIVICSGETVYPWQYNTLKDVFKCKIVVCYGHNEQVALASSCEHSDYYHFFPEYGIVELIGPNGKPVKKEGEIGEIVATGFKNFIFPFIRYKTGDLGVYTSKHCSCGRNYPLLKRIEGRLQEYLITKNNSLISMATVAIYNTSHIFDNVKKFQFYQEEKGRVILRIVKMNIYNEKDTEFIKKELSKKLGENIKLEIKFVDDIPRTSRRKYSYLIQKIPIEIKDL